MTRKTFTTPRGTEYYLEDDGSLNPFFTEDNALIELGGDAILADCEIHRSYQSARDLQIPKLFMWGAPGLALLNLFIAIETAPAWVVVLLIWGLGVRHFKLQQGFHLGKVAALERFSPQGSKAASEDMFNSWQRVIDTYSEGEAPEYLIRLRDAYRV